MPLLTVQNLSLVRRNATILQNISFDIERGEVLVIIGASGSGKTSLLRCLNRLEEPSQGNILVDAVDYSTFPVTRLRQRIGFVFQKTAIFEGSVADNIRFGPALQGEHLSDGRLGELMEMVSLEEKLLGRNAAELSGGQEQRMALARALANTPDILLLDEPTSALDPATTLRIEETLLSLRDQLNLTLVWVSHAIEQARRVAERVMLLDNGQLLRVDTVEAMLHPEQGDPRVLAFASGEQ